jgi:hypothetical protein
MRGSGDWKNGHLLIGSAPSTNPGPQWRGSENRAFEDEQALARYRYMLKTAPPETIEQAHVEAFARLTPEQRRMLLEQLRAEIPEAERAYATENPQALARLATRAEVRQPGTMERVFSGIPVAAPGFGGMMAGSLWEPGRGCRHDDRPAFPRQPGWPTAIWTVGTRPTPGMMRTTPGRALATSLVSMTPALTSMAAR